MTGLQSFKIIFDSLNTLSKIHDDNTRALAIAEIIGQLSKAQGELIMTQQRELALTDEKRALETEAMRLRDWSTEKTRYKLTEHGDNRVLAYAFQRTEGSKEPPHSLCPDCFSKSEKSILQPETMDIGRAESLACHACGWRGWVRGHVPSPPMTRGRR
jgi:hypothetical protein